MTSKQVFTGRSRERRTRWAVRVADVVSKLLITVGGLGTIIAVSTVLIFLIWVAAPLFTGARTGEHHGYSAGGADAALHVEVDEYGLVSLFVHPDGRAECRRLDTGEVIEEVRPLAGASVTAFAPPTDDGMAIAGFSDGRAAFGRIGFATEFVELADAPQEIRSWAIGQRGRLGAAMLERISESQFRARKLSASFAEPMDADHPVPIRRLAQARTPAGRVYVALSEDASLNAYRLTERKNILTGETAYRRTRCAVPYEAREDRGLPDYLLVSGLGDFVTVAWRDGYAVRFNIRDPSNAFVEERLRFVDEEGVELTALRYLLGGATILAGDSTGRVRAWFPVRADYAEGDQRQTRLVAAHEFESPGAAVTALSSSSRMRLFTAGHADGSVRLHHVTSHKLLAEMSMQGAVRHAVLSPKDDLILAVSAQGAAAWGVEPGYPEATFGSLFRPVWYEGARKPEHVWQSSSGTDDFEPKLGLVPLVFGTIKATVFSLLFGVPVALLAAVFTSEFLNPRMRSRIKPMVEMMASLPSVVLGFLAALVFAPIVSRVLPAFLSAFITVPLAFFAGAYLWQLLPRQFALRIQHWRFPLMFLAIPAGIGAAMGLGPAAEKMLFSGDIIRWLDGQIGSAWGGWVAVMIPICALAVAWLFSVFVDPRVRRASMRWPRSRCALVDLFKFAAGLVSVVGLAAGCAAALSAMGLDPRGGVFGTYVQRNALIVGFVMGFAVIPIIYTIAEDALTAVPEHLRSASLAAGATPWQTAVRIIIPTAMSGLFSAIMIGLGRAVGETMIVLMAAGNTPVMEWNIFNGFRTLSANIAVELPEAVRNSTHYRTLFLAALVLFAMTFALNTIAEMVRIRFRRKAVEL